MTAHSKSTTSKNKMRESHPLQQKSRNQKHSKQGYHLTQIQTTSVNFITHPPFHSIPSLPQKKKKLIQMGTKRCSCNNSKNKTKPNTLTQRWLSGVVGSVPVTHLMMTAPLLVSQIGHVPNPETRQPQRLDTETQKKKPCPTKTGMNISEL